MLCYLQQKFLCFTASRAVKKKERKKRKKQIHFLLLQDSLGQFIFSFNLHIYYLQFSLKQSC